MFSVLSQFSVISFMTFFSTPGFLPSIWPPDSSIVTRTVILRLQQSHLQLILNMRCLDTRILTGGFRESWRLPSWAFSNQGQTPSPNNMTAGLVPPPLLPPPPPLPQAPTPPNILWCRRIIIIRKGPRRNCPGNFSPFRIYSIPPPPQAPTPAHGRRPRPVGRWDGSRA